MSLQTFFLTEQILGCEKEESFELRLSADDLRHFDVLRLRAGEHIAVVDADSDYFECAVVAHVRGARPLVRIAARRDAMPAACDVTLLQGIPKGDKLDDIVRHGTEIGLGSFVPVAFSRCVSRLDGAKAEKKRARWQAIAKSAAMQSGRTSIPQVLAPRSPKDASELMRACDRVIVFWEGSPEGEREAPLSIRAALELDGKTRHPASVAVVVGPEGGLSAQEVDEICDACPQARVATLGGNILRTETAGVVGSALVLYELGGLGNEGGRA